MAVECVLVAAWEGGSCRCGHDQSPGRVWGAEGWLSMALISGAPMEWHLNRSAGIEKMAPPAGGSGESYSKFVQAAIDAARGAAPPPVTATECLKALEAVFALYHASSTRPTPRLA